MVSFRGTDVEDTSNLVFDVDLELEKWPGPAKVHRGFAKALEEVRPDLLLALESIGPCRSLYTGHSLGAAMATLMAGLRRPNALYTFGSPLVGDVDFVAALQNLKSFRYVDCLRSGGASTAGGVGLSASRATIVLHQTQSQGDHQSE